MRKLVIGLALILSGFITQAQEAWSLSKCIEHAIGNNIQVKQNMLSAELAKANYDQSVADMIPSLNAGASHGYNWGQRIDPFTNQFATNRVRSNNFGLSSSVTLFNGMQKQNTLKKNDLDLTASRYDVETMQNDIALNVATAYLQVLFSEELLLVAQNQLLITDNQLDRTSKLVDAGVLPEGNLFDIQAQLASDELQVSNAENQRDLAYLSLRQLMNLNSNATLTIEKPQIEIPADALSKLNPKQIYQTALGNQPQIKSAETTVLSADKSVAIAKGTASPSVTITGSVGTGYSGLSKEVTGYTITTPPPSGYTASGDTVFSLSDGIIPTLETKSFSDQLEQNLNENLTFNLNIPIFNGWQSRTAIARAKINQQNAQLALEASKLQLEQTIQQAHADAKASLKQYFASIKALEALETSFEYAQKRFEVGLLNPTDFNETKTRLTNAESEAVRAKYDYVFKLKVLDFYQGKPLTLK